MGPVLVQVYSGLLSTASITPNLAQARLVMCSMTWACLHRASVWVAVPNGGFVFGVGNIPLAMP